MIKSYPHKTNRLNTKVGGMEMRKKCWLLACCILLSSIMSGCGENTVPTKDFEDEKTEESTYNNENVESSNSLFPGTIFDYIVIGETSMDEFTTLLNKRGLEYQGDRTIILDEFYDWEVNYHFYEGGSTYTLAGTKGDNGILSYLRVNFLINEDSDYREICALIQNTIEENLVTTPLEFDSVFSERYGIESIYPVGYLTFDEVDYIEYIQFIKYPNYNNDGYEHAISLVVSFMPPDLYDMYENEYEAYQSLFKGE